jgi:hypothetical protein
MDGQTDGYVISSIPSQSVNLVDDDVVDVLLIFQPIQQLLKSWTISRAGAGASINILSNH